MLCKYSGIKAAERIEKIREIKFQFLRRLHAEAAEREEAI